MLRSAAGSTTGGRGGTGQSENHLSIITRFMLYMYTTQQRSNVQHEQINKVERKESSFNCIDLNETPLLFRRSMNSIIKYLSVLEKLFIPVSCNKFSSKNYD